MLEEEDIRKKVKALRRFYMDMANFAAVNVVLIVIWWTFDKTGTFWPKYVIVVWGILLVFRASRLGLIPFIFHRMPFFSDTWEERKVTEMMRRHGVHHKPSAHRRKKKK